MPNDGDAAELRERLYGRFNNRALETGERLQGDYFLNIVEEFSSLDEEFTEAWLTWIYDYMYGRSVLEEKTRILVVLGECCVVGYLPQIPNHIRSAMRVGATREECLEVVLQSAIYAGIPRMRAALKAYKEVFPDQDNTAAG